MKPLSITCTECPNDRLVVDVQNEDEIALSAFHREGDPDCPGFTDEVVIYLNRAGAEQVHSWLSEWLGR